jgi:hypothetical protein
MPADACVRLLFRSDSHHFVGAAALLNSLRLVGHDEPIFLVDAGLTSEQRDLVARHVTLIPAPEGAPTVFLTPLGPLELRFSSTPTSSSCAHSRTSSKPRGAVESSGS